MDVARPGRGKVVGTSRPVIAPIVSDSKASNIDDKEDKKDETPITISTPSESRKVIKPLTDDLADDDSSSSETKPSEPNHGSPVIESTEVKPKDIPETPNPAVPAETVEAEQPAEKGNAASEEGKLADEASESAGVDALAAQAETKKQAAKRAEEEAKRDEELKKLIDSKKYHVPIKHSPQSSGGKIWAVVIIVLIFGIAAAGYYYWDMRTSSDAAQQNKEAPAVVKQEPSKNEQPKSDTNAINKDSASEIAARDSERKKELKNLQQKIETYYNDNNEYPASLSVLNPAVSDDETTGPAQDAYVYTPSADGRLFVLTATLENPSDKDAENGQYVIRSVNE